MQKGPGLVGETWASEARASDRGDFNSQCRQHTLRLCHVVVSDQLSVIRLLLQFHHVVIDRRDGCTISIPAMVFIAKAVNTMLVLCRLKDRLH